MHIAHLAFAEGTKCLFLIFWVGEWENQSIEELETKNSRSRYSQEYLEETRNLVPVFLIFNASLSTLYKKIREKREVRGRKNIFEVSLSRYKWSRKFFSDNEIRCLSRNLWCPGRDLNSYTVRQRLLRPSCLPIPPPGQDMMNLEVLSYTNFTSWMDRNMVGRAGFEPAKS